MKFLELYKTNAGNVSDTCDAINICRATYYDWYNHDEKFKQKIDEYQESLIDFTESQLMQLIQEKEPSAIYFHLKCRGKKRGYVERPEQENYNEKQIADSLADLAAAIRSTDG